MYEPFIKSAGTLSSTKLVKLLRLGKVSWNSAVSVQQCLLMLKEADQTSRKWQSLDRVAFYQLQNLQPAKLQQRSWGG